MDELEKPVSDSPQTESGSGEANKTLRRANRRRNRKRRPKTETSVAEEQVQEVSDIVEITAEPSRPLTGNAAKPKRRNAPRRSALPEHEQMPHVMKATAPQLAPLQPMRLRTIDSSDTSEPIIGCPMLTRTRLGIPFRGGNRVARCSAGWSVHDEDEVLLCMHTESAAQCWKEHPEHLEELVEKLRPVIEAELAEN